MKIRFYTDFKKMNNSTKKPKDGTLPSITYDGWFKEATSINTPVMQIDITPKTTPLDFVYCYIEDLGKYYFVQDIVSRTNKIWDYYLVEDCLATWRDKILNSSQYVIRSLMTKTDKSFVDDQMVLSADYEYHDVKIDGFIDTSTVTDGCFCLGIQKDGAESGAFVAGSVSYYILSPASLQQFINALISLDLSGDTGLSKMATFSAVNPIQYIVSCVWLPFTIKKIIAQTGNGAESIGVLDWNSGVNGYRVKNTAIYSDRGRVLVSDIPKHPQKAGYGRWVDVQASQYALTLRGYGQIGLDPIITGACDQIIGDQYIDVTSGASVLKVYGKWTANNYTQFQSQMNAQLGVSIQLSQIQKDIYATATIMGSSVPVAMIDAVGGTQALTGAISNIAQSLDNAISASTGSGVSSIPQVAGNALNDAFSVRKGSITDKAIQAGQYIYNQPNRMMRAYEASHGGAMHSQGGHFSRESKDRATPISDFASKLNSALTSYMHNFGVTSGSVGSTGTFASLGGIDELYCYFQLYGGFTHAIAGTPECRMAIHLSEYMNTNEGQEAFVQILNPRVNFGNTYEKAKIIDYMSGGMYLE
jgi:hypothetical protein